MSCSSATIAPIAIFGWKRAARNTTTAARKTTSAISAWLVMSLAPVGTDRVLADLPAGTPGGCATASLTSKVCCWVSWPVRSRIVFPPTTWALDDRGAGALGRRAHRRSSWL